MAGTGRTRRVLQTINREGPLTPSELAAREGVSRVAMSHRLSKLRARRQVILDGHRYSILPRGRRAIGLNPFPRAGVYLDEDDVVAVGRVAVDASPSLVG